MKRKTHFKEMFLVDKTFFNKVNNDNRVSVSNTFSPKEVFGSKNDDCTECESPAFTPLQPSQPIPAHFVSSPSVPPPPSIPPPSIPSVPSPPSIPPPPSVPPPSLPPVLPHSVPPPSSVSTTEGVKPFETEAHQWIDNVAAQQMDVDTTPKPHMGWIHPQSLAKAIDYYHKSSKKKGVRRTKVPRVKMEQKRPKKKQVPAVEMEQAAPSLPDPKYLLWGQEEREDPKHFVTNRKPELRSPDVEMEALPAPKYLLWGREEQEAPKQVVTYKKPELRSPDVEMEALPAPKYLLWGRQEREAPNQVVTYRKPELRSPDVEIEALPAPKEPIYPLTIPTVNEYSSFLCTLCNTYFKTRKGLERHNKNIHDAYQQKKKGIKRRMEKEDKYPKKYVKWN